MITSSVKELNSTKAKVARLELELAKELASLPAAYGFDSHGSFVAALKAAANKGGAPRPKKPKAVKVRKRAKITDAVRAKVKTLVKAGKTGAAIAKTLGISLPSVQNIKKALGLVTSSKKAPAKPKARRKPAKVKPAKVKAAPAPKAKKKRVPSKKKAAASAPAPSPVAPEAAATPAA